MGAQVATKAVKSSLKNEKESVVVVETGRRESE